MGAAAERSRRRSFLPILLIAGVLALPVVWMSWHAWRRNEVSSSERCADGVLVRLCSLEALLRHQDADRNGVEDFWTGDVAGLLSVFPDGAGYFNDASDFGFRSPQAFLSAVAHADPSRADGKPCRGYWFVPMDLDERGRPYRPDGRPHHPTAFAFCAYPARVGWTGGHTYIYNQNNSGLRRPAGPSPVRQWPTEPEVQHSWSTYGG
jgi:hypothetical protein